MLGSLDILSRRILLVALVLSAGCGEGSVDSAAGGPRHPLAASLARAVPNLTGLENEEIEAVRTFVGFSDPRTSPFELQRISGIAGRGLARADPVVIARFVAEGRDWLYDEFFAGFDERDRALVALTLSEVRDVDEMSRLRMEVVVRRGGEYPGTLANAMADVPFGDAIVPLPVPLHRLEPGEEGRREIFTGAGELLRLDAFVAEGAQKELAAETFRTALRKWPGDPVLVAALACFYIENEDRFGAELTSFLTKAEELDGENAVYPYLRAARAFRAGHDQEGLQALRIAADRPKVTLHASDRIGRMVQLLTSLGYGPLRARLAACRSVSMAPWFDLKDLANRAILRSYEYEETKEDLDLRQLLDFPRALDRQLGTAGRSLVVEQFRLSVLAAGLTREAEYYRSRNPVLAAELTKRLIEVSARDVALQRGAALAGGSEGWEVLYSGLTGDQFLAWVDRVLLVDEAGFLYRCAEAGNLDRVVELAISE